MTIELKDGKLCGCSSYLRRAILFIKIKKAVIFMRSLHTLFKQLEKLEQYQPKNMASNMNKMQHIQDIKKQIWRRIDINDYKQVILEKNK